MRILMYSDVHISKTSSILPSVSDNYKYTYRQNMILDLAKYLCELVEKYKPDILINLGDTFDNHTLTSYDIDVVSKFFKEFRMFSIPHLVLVGNHEMINSDFNAVSILSNINNITVISEPSTINSYMIKQDEPDIKLAFLPYCNYKDIVDFPEGDFLFSHIDIQGSSIRKNIVLPTGVEQEIVSEKYKFIFNGHIHKPSIMKNIINVGSCTTHSFSDDEDTVPQCYIFDTDTLNLTSFKPTCCPLFRRCYINNMNDLQNYIQTLDQSYKYVLHITCPFELKTDVKSFIETTPIIINSRLNVIVNTENQIDDVNTSVNLESNLTSTRDVNGMFKSFLDCIELKYPKDIYYKVLEEVE